MDDSYDPILPESPEPILPKSPSPPPFKRLWKEPQEPDEAEVTASTKKVGGVEGGKTGGLPTKAKRKKIGQPVDDGTGATKLEETPVLDTYEARQRARWIIGGLLGAIGMIAMFIILKAFRGNGMEEIREGEPPPINVAAEPRSNGEVEARNMLDMAKQADKNGKTLAAVAQLNKLTKNYQGTAAGKEALHAIERHRRKQSLFGADVPEQMGGPKAPNSGTPLANGPATPKTGNSLADVVTNPPTVTTNDNKSPAPIAPVVPTVLVKPLPRGYRANLDAPVHATGWPTRIVCDYDGGELALVPGGTFIMGREDGDPAERPAHTVTLSTYYIDLHEVTVRQFLLFAKQTGRHFDAAKIAPRETTDPPMNDEYPVVNVSWREAKAFCEWANRKLPTEAQWEMAARYPSGKISFWGGDLPRKDPGRGPRIVEPVKSLPTDLSASGVYDLGANAWEWTSEYYDSQYFLQFRNPVTDPTGPKESKAKIVLATVKGGSKQGILTWRDGLRIENRQPYLGFRGALSVEAITPPSGPVPQPSNNATLPGGVVPF